MENILIQLNNISVFQREILILSGLNLSVSKGEFVYLIGKTGSGKSSLLKILYGDLAFNDGEGRVLDFDLKLMKPKELPLLRRKIGIVFQDFQLLTDRNVTENLLFVMKATGWKDKAAMQARIAEVLEQVGLGRKGNAMPHQLSGGEQQRVVIARALINDPDIILADEPTGNLDPETSENLIALLHDISVSGKTVIIATHQYALFEKFPARTLACENGKLTDSSITPISKEDIRDLTE